MTWNFFPFNSVLEVPFALHRDPLSIYFMKITSNFWMTAPNLVWTARKFLDEYKHRIMLKKPARVFIISESERGQAFVRCRSADYILPCRFTDIYRGLNLNEMKRSCGEERRRFGSRVLAQTFSFRLSRRCTPILRANMLLLPHGLFLFCSTCLALFSARKQPLSL